MASTFDRNKVTVHTLVKWEAQNLIHFIQYLDVSDDSKAHYSAVLEELVEQIERRRNQLLSGGA